MWESSTRYRTGFTTPGDAQAMPVLSHLHYLFNAEQYQNTSRVVKNLICLYSIEIELLSLR
jgi:hypothetical protein